MIRQISSTFVCLWLCAQARAAAVPPDLARAVHDYDEAQVHGDRAALERLLADDYTLVNSAGAIESKSQLIADYTAPGYKLEPFTVRDAIEKVWKDGAVMGGIATLRGLDGGKTFAATLRFADIWARRDGRWQVIYTQVGRAPAAQGPVTGARIPAGPAPAGPVLASAEPR